jgi:hypothetical protein
MIGVNNIIDMYFPKDMVDIITSYHYYSDDDVFTQLADYCEIVEKVKALGLLNKKYDVDIRFNIRNKIELMMLTYNNIERVKSPLHVQYSAFQNDNAFLTTREHQMLVQSYQKASIDVPLFIQQSGFFYEGIFPKMGIGSDAETIYEMVVTGDLKALTYFNIVRGDNAACIVDFKSIYDDGENLLSIDVRNGGDNVAMLDTYANGEETFLKYVIEFYNHVVGKRIIINITDHVIVRDIWSNAILYSDDINNRINVDVNHYANADVNDQWGYDDQFA